MGSSPLGVPLDLLAPPRRRRSPRAALLLLPLTLGVTLLALAIWATARAIVGALGDVLALLGQGLLWFYVVVSAVWVVILFSVDGAYRWLYWAPLWWQWNGIDKASLWLESHHIHNAAIADPLTHTFAMTLASFRANEITRYSWIGALEPLLLVAAWVFLYSFLWRLRHRPLLAR